MQEQQMTDPVARKALALTQTRIHAIGQIHHCLYTGEDVMHVDMAVYLDSLVERLRWMLACDNAPCPIAFESAPLLLKADKAVAVGMIVLELITNACKYAYPADHAGPVAVTLTIAPDGSARLSVADDGCGMQADAKPRGTGLGSGIITAMTRSLRGTLTYPSRERGVTALLTFRPD
jgi:two-component sensor histidine kinase